MIGKLTLVPVRDAGRVICQVVRNPEVYAGKTVGLAGDHLSGDEIVATFKTVTGNQARFEDVPLETVREKNPDGANMWEFKRLHEDTMARYVAESRAIVPDILSLADWLRANWPKH
mmetsp:Transcript_68300/g.160612  ORF Transcript_68300/g.160612 Transcript_68300/m.160612 type:complete len:116 (-) Transcript_68300:23-370(-)